MDRFVKSVRHRVEVKKSEYPVEVKREFLKNPICSVVT